MIHNSLTHAVLLTGTALLLAWSSSIQAQEIGGGWTTQYDFYGSPGDRLGNAIAIAGDVNGDGYDDILIASENASTTTAVWGGSAKVISGLDGSTLFQFDGATTNEQFGHSVAGLGDVDGDGFSDFAISAWRAAYAGSQSGSIFVYSGATGSLLYRFDGANAFVSLGAQVSAVGDLNGDGFMDIMASSEVGTMGEGGVYVWSGATGSLLLDVFGPQTGIQFGSTIAGPGDIDGDGVPDLLIGAPKASSSGLSYNGAAFVYSGATGQLHVSFAGSIRREYFGTAVDGIGDLNQDGSADFIIGAPGFGSTFDLDNGRATVYSGQTSTALYYFDGLDFSSQLGSGVAGIGDFNGDSTPDFAIGAQLRSPMSLLQAGTIAIHSGADGQLLYTFAGETPFDKLGNHIAGGDINNDGRADLVFASATANPNWLMDSGAAYVRAGFDPYLTSTSAQLSASAGGIVQFDMNFPADAANNSFALVASDFYTPSIFNGVLVPLDTSTLIWQQMWNAPPPAFANPVGVLDSNGDAICVLTAPPNAFNFLAGSTLSFAALCKDSTTFNRYSSAAVTLRILP